MSKIYAAMADAMADVDAIGKDKRNGAQGFNFRGIDDVYNKLHGVMAKHRIFTAPEVIASESQERKTSKGGTLIYRILTIKYHFFCDDGSSVDVTVIGEGMDSGDKASNKAMSIAHKYALFQVFMIPTEDIVDPDAETPPKIEPKASRETDADPELLGIGEQMKSALASLAEKADPEIVDGYKTDGVKLYRKEDKKGLRELVKKVENWKPAADSAEAAQRVFADDLPEDVY